MGGRALAAMALAAGLMLGGGAWAQDDDPPAIDAATLDGVAAFARITAQAPGQGRESRFVTLDYNDKDEMVLTGLGVLAPGQAATAPEGTAAVLILHAKGVCATPHGADDALPAPGVSIFVSDAKGRHIWLVEPGPDGARIALVSGEGGPWEAFREDPKGYRTYACGKYR